MLRAHADAVRPVAPQLPPNLCANPTAHCAAKRGGEESRLDFFLGASLSILLFLRDKLAENTLRISIFIVFSPRISLLFEPGRRASCGIPNLLR